MKGLPVAISFLIANFRHGYNRNRRKNSTAGRKYAAMGQNLSSYLDGLLYADYLTYWDYIQLDVLLNLQHPRAIPDERILSSVTESRNCI